MIWWIPSAAAEPLAPYATHEALLPRKDARDGAALTEALADLGVTAHLDGPMSTIARWVAFRAATGGMPTPSEMDAAAWEIGTPLILDWMDHAAAPPIAGWAATLAERAFRGHTAIGIGSFGIGRDRVVAVVSSHAALALEPIARDPGQPMRVSGRLAAGGTVELYTLPGPRRAAATDDSGAFQFELPAGVEHLDLVVVHGNVTTEIARLDLVVSPPAAPPPDGEDPASWVRDAVGRLRREAGAGPLAELPFVPCGEVPAKVGGVAVSATQRCYAVTTQADPVVTWNILASRPNALWQLADERFDALGIGVDDGELAFHLYQRVGSD